jgi:GcrA cell cycle regulator
MSWTPEREEKLKQLWKKGHSGSQIARLLGDGATRNSVLGKSFRLKLQSRVVTKKTTPRTNTEKDNSPEIKAQKLGRKEKFKALLISKNFPPEQPTILEDLNQDTCRYPLGEKLEPAKFFCGRKPVDKYPYCELHMLYSFSKKDEKEEDQIAEEDIPKFIEKKIKLA